LLFAVQAYVGSFPTYNVNANDNDGRTPMLQIIFLSKIHIILQSKSQNALLKKLVLLDRVRLEISLNIHSNILTSAMN